MSRRGIMLWVGVVIVLALASAILLRFTSYVLIPRIMIGLIAMIIAFGALAIVRYTVLSPMDQVLFPRKYTLEDDRGQRIRVDEAGQKLDIKLTKEQLIHMAALRKKRKPALNYSFALASGFITASIVAVGFLVIYSIAVPGYLQVLWWIAVIVAGRVFGRQLNLLHLNMLRAGAVVNHRCPGCRYELHGLSPESDGCVVCPECSAAWRLDHCPKCTRPLESADADLCPDCGWKRANRESDAVSAGA